MIEAAIQPTTEMGIRALLDAQNRRETAKLYFSDLMASELESEWLNAAIVVRALEGFGARDSARWQFLRSHAVGWLSALTASHDVERARMAEVALGVLAGDSR